jgi:hypothetical protein
MDVDGVEQRAGLGQMRRVRVAVSGKWVVGMAKAATREVRGGGVALVLLIKYRPPHITHITTVSHLDGR